MLTSGSWSGLEGDQTGGGQEVLAIVLALLGALLVGGACWVAYRALKQRLGAGRQKQYEITDEPEPPEAELTPPLDTPPSSEHEDPPE